MSESAAGLFAAAILHEDRHRLSGYHALQTSPRNLDLKDNSYWLSGGDGLL